ncbi:type VI secretion system protein TssA [Pseudomonas eucalypticola]|uniref:Type VI secretion system protein TssA n=1 Tax=Pseudomonas eucalypticola TaxID=2599595 RepID=A0A7D5H429_9PSED|nr:type VI secretion system protein TssA [Pseudomonas eucalypticola]QKZ02384.1 type VI secretion system protein TssA [Pseudomonas eucalypticola]
MSETLRDLSMADLTAPINGASGEDLSFSLLFDQIKEARRADPDYLTQGDWQTDLKSSDWDLTIQLSAQGLAHQSKDLMLVAWLNEALAQKYAFEGITFGLTLATQILEQYWPSLYPSLDEGIEERAARLNWLKASLTDAVGMLPITQGDGFGLIRYDESRHVENLALQNPKAMATALDEGKINADIFQRSVVLTDSDYLHEKAEHIQIALLACRTLQARADHFFGADAPSFATLDDALHRAQQLAVRLLKDRGIELNAPPAEADPVMPDIDDPTPPTPTSAKAAPGALRTTPVSREEAFSMLAGVVQYFKQAEPHSPVPYLVERAIKWGNMPLESWLSDVIKDNGVVDSIKDVLGTKESKN